MQHSPPHLPRLPPIRGPARVAMLQPFAARLAIAPPHPFGLAVAQLQHRGGIAQLQILVRHPPHHLHSLQLPPTHRCPLQQTSSGWRFSLRGHFYRVREGTLSKSFNSSYIGKTAINFRGKTVLLGDCYGSLRPQLKLWSSPHSLGGIWRDDSFKLPPVLSTSCTTPACCLIRDIQ